MRAVRQALSVRRAGPQANRRRQRVHGMAAERIVWNRYQGVYSDSSHPERGTLIKWEAGTRHPRCSHPGGEDIFVLEGPLADEAGHYPRGNWILIHPVASTSRTHQKAAYF